MIDLMKGLADLNEIRFSAYRTAMKLRSVQKALSLDRIPMAIAIESFDRHGLRAQNDKLIDIPDMTTVLHSLYVTVDKIDLTKLLDLAINWILNVYDSQRTGQIRVLSFKVNVSIFCFLYLAIYLMASLEFEFELLYFLGWFGATLPWSFGGKISFSLSFDC